MNDLLMGVHVVVKTLSLEISRYRLRRLRQRILLKCVPHVQHDYFSSFNQSEHCFLALSLPFPSSLAYTPSLTVESGSFEPVNIFGRIGKSAAYIFYSILQLLREVKHFIYVRC